MAAADDHLEEVLKGRFIRRVFAEAAGDIGKAQEKYMRSRSFESQDWYSGREYKVDEKELQYTHLLKHRFVDMKRMSKKAKQYKRRPHPIHNRILWGHYNNIIREMAFGFTDAIKEQLKQLDD